MKFFQRATDGGKESHVTGFFFIEIKPLFSIVLLHFRNGTREAFHSHAFNALTWFIKGRVEEHRIMDPSKPEKVTVKQYGPSLKPKYTPRENHHKVYSLGDTYALSFRGPWAKTWREYLPGVKKFVTLTNGRKVVATDERLKLIGVAGDIVREVERASTLFPPMINPHEALGLIQEEYDEFKDEVYAFNVAKGHDTRPKMKAELIQLAAMCIRALRMLEGN